MIWQLYLENVWLIETAFKMIERPLAREKYFSFNKLIPN